MEQTTTSAVSQAKDWHAQNQTRLQNAGIETISAEYSGEGDEGQLDCVYFLDEHGKQAEPFEKDAVHELFEALYDDLSLDGYANNEGGGGKLTLCVRSGKITHESYWISTEHTYDPAKEY